MDEATVAVKKFRLPMVDYGNQAVVVVPLSEGFENSVKFEVVLYDDNGDLRLNSSDTVYLNGVLPSGTILTDKLDSGCVHTDKNGSVISFYVPSNFGVEPGRVSCEIMIINTEGDEITNKSFLKLSYIFLMVLKSVF